MERELTDEVESALAEMQRYLLDQIPPLNAVDSFEVLAPQPPQLLMRMINAWAVEQKRIAGFPMADLLFHALKKVNHFGSLKLLERSLVDAYVEKLIPLAMETCPPEDRDLLRTNLTAMRDSRNISVAAVELSRTERPQPKQQQERTSTRDDLMARSARRLSLVVDRLTRFLPGRGGAAPAEAAGGTAAGPTAVPAQAEDTSAQLVTMAAASSTSEEELERYVQSIRPFTGEGETSNLIRILAGSVPAWDIVPPADLKVQPSAPVQAMHKIISLTKNTNESTKRFRELLTSAIEQFNSGSLSAAASMLELADIVVAEKKLDAITVDRIRADTLGSISSEQLKKYTENRSKHAVLRKVLAFFPALTRESLLKELRGEEKPERRRSLLALLEAWGPAAREAALADLDAELKRPEGEADTYYLRNLIYLLHRIPRESETSVDREVELMTRATARGQSIYVIKEAMLVLGQIKTEAVVKLLTMRLAETEAMLVRKDATYPADEMQKLLDRICAALARIATPPALLTIARHGMKPNPLLGDTRGRLAALGAHDLSFDEATVNVIVNALRDSLPKKILGKYLPYLQQPPLRLIESLSSTRSEAVEKFFAEIAANFSDHEIGRAASAALENLRSTGKTTTNRDGAAVSLSGDLQFFGLPSLLQSLADQQATGIVTLTSKASGQTAGKLLFVEGQFADAQTGHLRGADALYQMLERPIVGHFAFVPQPVANVKGKTQTAPVMPLLLEGIRRHDELKQAVALVPDHVALKAATTKPSPDPNETDPAILREVWVKATAGTPVGQWESQIAADAYRVRRVLAHWLEEGALQPA